MRQVDKEVMQAVSAADLVNFTESGDVAGKVKESAELKEAQAAMWLWSLFEHAGQSWGCSQVVYELEERDVMDCLWDDELTKWEEDQQR